MPGTVTPLRSAHIYARASGYLKARYVDLGDMVRKGQLLGTISAPDLDSSVAQQAALVQQSKDSVSTAQSTLRLQQATYARVHTLVLHGILSRQEDDSSAGSRRIGTIEPAGDGECGEGSGGGLGSCPDLWLTSSRFARQSAAGSPPATSRWAIWCRLREPHRVWRLPLPAPRAGHPRGGAQGGELFDVVDLGSLEVFVSVPEQDAPFVQTGQPVDLTFSELPGETFKGKVVRSSDSLSQQTRTLLAEIQLTDTLHACGPACSLPRRCITGLLTRAS